MNEDAGMDAEVRIAEQIATITATEARGSRAIEGSTMEVEPWFLHEEFGRQARVEPNGDGVTITILEFDGSEARAKS